MESISKNLWLLLTLLIPGFFTYGVWRLGLYFVSGLPGSLSHETLKQIDASNMTTTCMILAFALIQQAVAISIEGTFYYFLNKARKKNRTKKGKKTEDEISLLETLFCERFDLAAKGQLNEQAERIIGNFFLSMNVSIGICLLIGYFAVYVGLDKSLPVFWGLVLLLPAAIITTYFRMVTAEKIITECKRNPAKTKKKDKTE